MFLQPHTAAPSRSASRWERLQVGLLLANLGWTTLCLGGYRPETMVVGSVLTALLVLVHLLGRLFAPTADAPETGFRRFHPAGWLPLPFLGYAAANAAWTSPVGWLAWRDWLGWAQMIAVFWVVLNGLRSRRARAVVFHGLVALTLIGVMLAVYQRFVAPEWLMLGRTQSPQFIGRASGSFGAPNSLAGLLILLIPGVVALAFRRGASAVTAVAFGYLALVLAVGLVLTISRGAWLALGIVALLAPLVAGRFALRGRIVLTLATAAILVGTGVALSQSPRIQRRLEAFRSDRGERSRPIMWRGAWNVFRQHPLVGAGAGNLAQAFEPYRPEGFQDAIRWAHNEYLQLLAEYGAEGFAFAAGAVIATAAGAARARRRQPRPAATSFGPPGHHRRQPTIWWPVPPAGLLAGLVAFALHLLFEFHLKIPALAMSFAVVAALWVQQAWPAVEDDRTVPGSLFRTAAILGAAALTAWVTVALAYPSYRGEALRLAGRARLDSLAGRGAPGKGWSADLGQARASLGRAVQVDPWNAAAWSDLAYARELAAHLAPGNAAELARQAEQASARALILSDAVPEFWIRRGVALDLQQRWEEAGAVTVQALKLAPARGDFWYYYAWHLSLRPEERFRADATAQFALRLDPSITAAQALRERLAVRTGAP